MQSPAALSAAAAFTLILDGLLRAVAAKIADYPCTSEMVVFLWKRVNRVKTRFLALAALIQAGRIPRARVLNPRARKRPDTTRPPEINWRKWLPMSRFAWLCRVMPSMPDRFGAASFASQLRHLLGQPELRAMLAATPKTARLLAPLCFMLGVEASLLRPAPSAPTPGAPGVGSAEGDPKQDAPTECADWPRAPDEGPPVRTVRVPDMPAAIFVTV